MVKAHGLKGALKLELYTDSPELRFAKGNQLMLQVPEDSAWFGKTVTVKELRWYNQSAVLFLEGVEDRDAAETEDAPIKINLSREPSRKVDKAVIIEHPREPARTDEDDHEHRPSKRKWSLL